MRAFVGLVLLAGCARAGEPPHPDRAGPEEAPTVATASTPAASEASPPVASVAQPDSAEVAPSASAEPAREEAPGATAAPSASVAFPAEPLPDVDVRNVGMHIGGGPNDDDTKRPIREAIRPHYDAFRACYAKADAPKATTTFGVDIRIPGKGGTATLTKPRTSLKGDGVVECMIAAFEKVEFRRPPGGMPMTVSYSLEFRAK